MHMGQFNNTYLFMVSVYCDDESNWTVNKLNITILVVMLHYNRCSLVTRSPDPLQI